MNAPGWQPSGTRTAAPPSIPVQQGGEVDAWAAIREVSARLVDALDDGINRARARQLIDAQVQVWANERMSAGRITTASEQQRLAQMVFDRRFGLGALQPFLERSDVENIVVNGCRQTWISYTNGSKEPGPPVAETDEDLIEWVQILARRGNTGREFSHASPLLDVALNDGVRLAVVGWVSRHPHLAMRVHRLVDITLRQLSDLGTLTPALEQFLRAAISARRNIIVCGEVNTGKTTLVRALAGEISPQERVITLESDFELFLDDPRLAHRHQDVVALEARQANSEGAGEVRLQDLVPACLRLNPDRVIVGEARHGELAPMLEVMYSGARGSMCTLHVHRPEHVFSRVVQLGRRADLGLGAEDVHLMFGLAEPLIVYLERDQATNNRYVSQVMEIGPPADSAEPTRNFIFTPGPDGRAIPEDGHISPRLLDDLVEHGFAPEVLAPAPARGGWA